MERQVIAPNKHEQLTYIHDQIVDRYEEKHGDMFNPKPGAVLILSDYYQQLYKMRYLRNNSNAELIMDYKRAVAAGWEDAHMLRKLSEQADFIEAYSNTNNVLHESIEHVRMSDLGKEESLQVICELIRASHQGFATAEYEIQTDQ